MYASMSAGSRSGRRGPCLNHTGVIAVKKDTRDQFLSEHGVIFLPRIGDNYEQGFNGHRLLVLGESHYDEWGGEKNQLENESFFTRECIQEVLNRVGGASFWKTLEQALLNETRTNGWAANGGHSLWDKLSFYNFVQSPVPGGPGARPKWTCFEESRKPFRAVLEQLRPDRILVCGKGLWKQMQETTQEGDYLHDDVQAYRLTDGTKVWCLATVHPSSGRYSWKRLYPLIMAFLDAPQKAAEMLRNSGFE